MSPHQEKMAGLRAAMEWITSRTADVFELGANHGRTQAKPWPPMKLDAVMAQHRPTTFRWRPVHRATLRRIYLAGFTIGDHHAQEYKR